MFRILYVLLFVFFISCDDDEIPEPTPTVSQPVINLPPVAVGGPDVSITLPDTSYVILDGTGSYDPDGIKITLSWTQIAGPPLASFPNPFTREGDALAYFSTSGKYLFQLKAGDNRFTTTDTVEVTVKWASDCNPNRELVSADFGHMSFSPGILPNGLSCAIGSDRLVLTGGILSEPFWPDDPPISYSDLFYVYDMKSNSWSESTMFRAKGQTSCVFAGNKLYIGGGVTNDGKVTDDVEIHDLATRTATRGKLSVPRSNLSVATAGNKVVFAGGSIDGGSVIDAVDIYDMSTNSWTTSKLSVPRRDLSSMVHGNKIYFVGGTTENDFSDAVDIYDASSGNWSVQRMSRKGNNFQVTLFGNQMVLSGGMTDISRSNSSRVEFVDLGNWESTRDCIITAFNYSDHSIRGESLNTSVIGDKIYFGDGESLSVFDHTTKSWKYAKMDSYSGLLFAIQGQLYSLRYNYSSMQFQVFRIRI